MKKAKEERKPKSPGFRWKDEAIASLAVDKTVLFYLVVNQAEPPERVTIIDDVGPFTIAGTKCFRVRRARGTSDFVSIGHCDPKTVE